MMSALTRPQARDWRWSLAAVGLALMAGLASRHFTRVLPAFLGKYPGDVLWALMVYFGVGLLLSRASLGRVAGLALAFCGAIEVLKLWRSPWWVGVRHTTAGHLVFGQVFSWQNLVAYAVGVALGLGIELAALPARRRGVPISGA